MRDKLNKVIVGLLEAIDREIPLLCGAEEIANVSEALRNLDHCICGVESLASLKKLEDALQEARGGGVQVVTVPKGVADA